MHPGLHAVSLLLDESEQPQTAHELAHTLLSWVDGPLPQAKVHIVVWEDEGNFNAQAYTTREGAERDFPAAVEGVGCVIVESTVQP